MPRPPALRAQSVHLELLRSHGNDGTAHTRFRLSRASSGFLTLGYLDSPILFLMRNYDTHDSYMRRSSNKNCLTLTLG